MSCRPLPRLRKTSAWFGGASSLLPCVLQQQHCATLPAVATARQQQPGIHGRPPLPSGVLQQLSVAHQLSGRLGGGCQLLQLTRWLRHQQTPAHGGTNRSSSSATLQAALRSPLPRRRPHDGRARSPRQRLVAWWQLQPGSCLQGPHRFPRQEQPLAALLRAARGWQ